MRQVGLSAHEHNTKEQTTLYLVYRTQNHTLNDARNCYEVRQTKPTKTETAHTWNLLIILHLQLII